MTEKVLWKQEAALRVAGGDIKVCIQAIEGPVLSGSIYHCCLENEQYFTDVADMVIKVDKILDFIKFPDAEPERRTIKPKKTAPLDPPQYCHDFKEFSAARKERFSFFLKIRYRQNVSWQGSVRFSGDRNSYQFRSVLELMGYIREKAEDYGK